MSADLTNNTLEYAILGKVDNLQPGIDRINNVKGDLTEEVKQAVYAEAVSVLDKDFVGRLLNKAELVDYGNLNPDTSPGVSLVAAFKIVSDDLFSFLEGMNDKFIISSYLTSSIFQSSLGDDHIMESPVIDSFSGQNNSVLVGTIDGGIKLYAYIFLEENAVEFIAGGLKNGELCCKSFTFKLL